MSKVLATEIQVPVCIGQQRRLIWKLGEVQQANRHTFHGTIARYIIRGDPELTFILIFFIWKDTEMLDESLPERSLKAL